MGQALGTPAFMSPEQSEGRLDLVDERTDVYSLGATLYMILTGAKPFSGSALDVISMVRRGSFPRPAVSSTVPRALEAVCLKAMQLDAADRYGNVRQLASDIDAYLDDQPVLAWREPVTFRVQRFLRRRQSFVLGTMLLLTIVGAGMIADAYRSELVANQLVADLFEKESLDRQATLASRVSEVFSGVRLDGTPVGLLGADYKDPDLVEAVDRVIAEMSGSPAFQTRLLGAIGDHFSMAGKLDLGDRYLTVALAQRRKTPGLSGEMTTTLHRVAFLRWMQGRIPEAKELAGQAIAIREKELGEVHEATIASKVLYLMVMSEMAEINDARVFVAISERTVCAWRKILEAKGEMVSAPDIGSIQLVIAGIQSYWGYRDKEASALVRGARIAEALGNYAAAVKSLENGHPGHPGRLLALLVELQLALPTKRNVTEILQEAKQISRMAFNGNTSHPGSLVIQLELIRHLPKKSAEAEKAMRQLHKEASPVFAGQPRHGSFTMELAEILFHRGGAADESGREQFYQESESLLHDAIAGWKTNTGPDSWQVVEALKKLGRIERERGEFARAAEQLRAAVQTYSTAGIQGYAYSDLQTRSELAAVLRKIGRTSEAKAFDKESREVRARHLEVLPEIVTRIYSGARTLGLAPEK